MPVIDSATARDERRFGARVSRSDLFLSNLQYQWNSFVTFGYEQGLYRTRAIDRFGALPCFAHPKLHYSQYSIGVCGYFLFLVLIQRTLHEH